MTPDKESAKPMVSPLPCIDHLDRNFNFSCANKPYVDALKKSEPSLQAQTNRIQHYIDAAKFTLIVLDDQHKVTLINQQGCKILGYDMEEVLGQDWFCTFLPPRHRESTRKAFQKLMAGEGEPVEYVENPVVTKTGEERLFAWHNNYIIDEGGAISGVISSGLDITDRKQFETALLQAHDELKKRLAIQAHDFERTNNRLIEEMRRHKNTLSRLEVREKELQRKSKRIAETNAALRVLLKNRDTEKEELEADLQMRISSLITPLLAKLQKSAVSDDQMAYIEILRQNLKTIFAPAASTTIPLTAKLTATEIQIANFIKQRKTNKEIAEIMGSSPRTVEKHRDHLRKKMGIQNRKINLREFLLYRL